MRAETRARGPDGGVEAGPVAVAAWRAGAMVIGETPSCRWAGRGRIGSRRAQSQMPWARISREPRSAAGAARQGRVGTAGAGAERR